MKAINHVSVGVNDVATAAQFYDALLAPLGIRRLGSWLPHAVVYGTEVPEFWVQSPFDGRTATAGNGTHVCFNAPDKDAVHAFHAAALAHGGRDDGAPGPRPDYTPDYYAAFVRDADGNKLEAVHFVRG